MNFKKGWSTHMPMLIKTVQMTNGPVLELGAGIFSTPLLHWLCAESQRKLVTYETNLEYLNFARGYRSRTHQIVDSLDKMAKIHWSVVLIDGIAYSRVPAAIKLKDSADYIILHDSDHSAYGYDNVYPHFKFVYHWKFCKPWTTVVSNFKEL
jgi:hypothetical protein